MSQFVSLQNEDSYTIITVLIEEFNLYISKEITPIIDHEVDSRSQKHLIFDLTRITYIDSSCIGYLLTLKKKLKPLEKEVVLVCDNDAVLLTLKVVNMDKIFKIFPASAEAIEFITSLKQ